MAFIRFDTGVWYELTSCVALVKPAAPLLPAITFDVEITSAMAAITLFCAKLEPMKRSVRFRAFFFIICISE